jgi:hypothetical protein
MKYFKSDGLPDWVGNALIGIIGGLIGCAFAWGQIRSEVSTQVTAQSADASDIKQLIIGQAGLVATVNAMSKTQEQLHIDFLTLMDAQSRSGDNSSLTRASGRH